MGREIKTREVHKDIKALDKAATAAGHIRHAYVRTKEQARPQPQEHASPVAYAEDEVSYTADSAAHGAARQAGRQGKRFVGAVQEKRRISKEAKDIRREVQEGKSRVGDAPSPALSKSGENTPYQPKGQIGRTAQGQAGQRAAQRQAAKAAEVQREIPRQAVKTIERGEKTIKTAGRVEQGAKTAGKGTVKYAVRSVKTAQQTAHKAVKTTGEAEKAARVTARAAAKTTEKGVRAARVAARTAERTVKATARATIAAVRAILAATKALMTMLLAGGWVAVLVLVIVLLFGGAMSVMGGGNASTVSPVSAEVEAYEPVLRRYANQYGIEEYVELLKAVMMQESGGRGLDPMQSSEGAFNTRYPREPNGITDPDYSIQCGVQELKAALVSAEVENPIDMERIKLALQGYNFGNGYISWAKRNYGGYSAANAAEFSDMMAQRMGWSNYGDKQYVPHVLRYYAFGRIPTGIGNQAIVQMALSQEGNVGGAPYWSWYGFEGRVAWCACFVSWCADQCGYIESGVIPKFALCSDGVAWFQQQGQWQDGSYVPAAGDIIFFDWGNDGSIDHVGIVEKSENGVVYTIEGNSGDRCRRRSYAIGNSEILGYGLPAY